MVFPHPSLAEDDGILAIGGDLSADRLILAYSNGIFPWYNEDEPIIWHAPRPRFVLEPKDLKISKSMRQLIRSKKYKITLNKDFESVIKNCSKVARKDQDGTWITNEMEQAYLNLRRKDYAHSIEVWNKEDQLVGGLYGINIGDVFFGESMFHLESNTSKLGFIALVENFPFSLIDCQVHTKHLESLGAKHMHAEVFYEKIVKDTKKNNVIEGNINFVISQ